MSRRWCPLHALAAVWLAASLAATAASAAWIEVPEPDLEALEPAVAEQLASLRELVVGLAGDADVAAPALGEAVGELARHYHAYGLSAEAEASYEIAARLAPEDFRWPYLLAYLLQEAGRLEEAVDLYQKALARAPNVPPALVRLGQAYLDLDRPREAGAVLERALELNPASAAAEAALGQLRLSERRYQEAAERLEAALELQPQANRLFYPLALAYRGLGDVEKAQEMLARRGEVGIRPADPLVDGLARLTTGERVHLLRGRAAFEAGSYESAVSEFELALAAEPESIRARLNLASALAETGRVEEAIGHLREVVTLAPGNATAHFNLALLHRRLGEAELALASLREAALYAPEDAGVRLELADALRAAGELEAALLQYGKAVALDPASEFSRVGEADALARLGRFEEALNRLEAAHRMMPSSGAIAHALARMLAGSPRVALRNGERAVELAESVFAALPTLGHLKTVAMAYAESGACETAAGWIEKGLEQAGQSGLAEPPPELLEMRARYAAGPPCRPPGLSEAGG